MATTVEPTVTFEATPVQERLMDVLTDGQSRLIGFGGGIRGTKTWGSLAALIALCRVFPGSRWFVLRKDLERVKLNVIPSFEKLARLAGGFVGEVNRSDWYASCANGSIILFRGENIDKDPELSRFHGWEANGFLLEEADELAERTFVKAIERAGTWIVPNGGEQPPPYVLSTFNPCPGWPRRRFYAPWRDKSIAAPYAFIPSTAADNPFVSDEQREAWREMPDLEYRRFVEGDWEALSGAYYDTLNPEVHLIDRDRLPAEIPSHWAHWSSFDWGYSHWSVYGWWVTDPDGVDYMLDSLWLRKMQDEDMATEIVRDVPEPHRKVCYAGHDCWNKVRAHAASGESTAEVFAKRGIFCVRADPDPINGGRAVNRAFKVRVDGQVKRSSAYVVKTKANLRVWDQLTEILPDELDIRKPGKVDADSNGIGGDDGADMVRHGIAAHHAARKAPATADTKQAHQAQRVVIKDGKLVTPQRPPQTVQEMVEWAQRRKETGRVPTKERVPYRGGRE